MPIWPSGQRWTNGSLRWACAHIPPPLLELLSKADFTARPFPSASSIAHSYPRDVLVLAALFPSPPSPSRFPAPSSDLAPSSTAPTSSRSRPPTMRPSAFSPLYPLLCFLTLVLGLLSTAPSLTAAYEFGDIRNPDLKSLHDGNFGSSTGKGMW